MILSSTLILLNLARAFNMSILQRLFKRKAKRSIEPGSLTQFNGAYFKENSLSSDSSSSSRYDQMCEKGAPARETRTDSNIDTVSDDDVEEQCVDNREQELQLQVNTLR